MRHRALPWLALLIAAAVNARASDAGLDMVLIVDRSRSIGSDDRRQENEVVDLTLAMLARGTRQSHLNHRVGVVSFGGVAQADIPLSPLDESTLPAIRHQLSTADSGRSLGNTNFVVAFGAAAGSFAAAPSEKPRRRAVLLITDGMAYVPGMSSREILRHVRQAVNAKLPSPTTIDVLILGSGGDGGEWRDSGMRLHRLGRDRVGALATLHRTVSDLIGTPDQQREMRGASDTIELPPYLDLVVFDILHDPPGSKVAVFVPGSRQPLGTGAPGVEELRLGDAFSTLAVHRPPAGTWTFRKENPSSRVRVLTQEFFPRGILIGPDPQAPLWQHENIAIAYRLLDANGALLRELKDYPLFVGLTLATPDGRRVALPMKRTSLAGVYRTTASTECGLPGRYWTEVTVNAMAGGHSVRVFEDRWSGFSVRTVPRVDCRLSAPGPGDRVRIECGHGGDAPLPVALGVAVHRDGKRVAPDLRLEYLGGGVFEGSLPASAAPGTYALRAMVEPSTPHLRFQPARVMLVHSRRWRMTAAIAAAALLAPLSMFAFRRWYVARRQIGTA